MYTLWQWTWGILQTAIGAILYLMNRKSPHFNFQGSCVTVWNSIYSVSLGKFIFVSNRNCFRYCQWQQASGDAHPNISALELKQMFLKEPYSRMILLHEYGHTIQSLILGPFYLLLVGLPSVIWNRLPYYRNKRYRTGISYYSAVFERTASTLGERMYRHTETYK